jgi:sterol desaturase/sphingolipid hydroxylase (fatty acid hydroxylase superfamily)
LLAVALWEFCRPRGRHQFPGARRRLGNLAFWLVNLVLAAFFFEPPQGARSRIEAVFGIGLPSWPVASAALTLLGGFLILDLLYYLVHRCEHAVPLLWRFHALHHSDPDVDVTTAVRPHPIEYLLTSGFYWMLVIVLDVPAFVVLTHGLAVFGMAAMQHGNVRLPERLERWLQPVLVTIDLHRVHHSVALEQANSNYGAVFSVWDRLFGTLTQMTAAEHQAIVFGVRDLPRRDCVKPSAMLMTPRLIARARRTAAAD